MKLLIILLLILSCIIGLSSSVAMDNTYIGSGFITPGTSLGGTPEASAVMLAETSDKLLMEDGSNIGLE